MQRVLGCGEPNTRFPDRRRRQRQGQVCERGLVCDHADELAHDAQTAGARDGTLSHRKIACDHAQQRRFPGAVGPDQSDLGALADPERHVSEEFPPVGEHVPDPGQVDVAHESEILLPIRSAVTGITAGARIAA